MSTTLKRLDVKSSVKRYFKFALRHTVGSLTLLDHSRSSTFLWYILIAILDNSDMKISSTKYAFAKGTFSIFFNNQNLLDCWKSSYLVSNHLHIDLFSSKSHKHLLIIMINKHISYIYEARGSFSLCLSCMSVKWFRFP